MIRKDYILRYFDELAKVLALVLKLKKDLKSVEAEAELNDFSTDFLGVNLEELLSTDKDNIIENLISQKKFTITHFKLLEDLFYHKHLINPSDDKLKKLTLEVLKYVSENDTDFSMERMSRIDQLSNSFLS
jgi:hypothetical protein